MTDVPFLRLNRVSEQTEVPAEILWNGLGLALLSLDAGLKRRLSGSDKRFTLSLIEGTPFSARLNTESSEIEISREFLSLLWVFSYLNFVYWEISKDLEAVGQSRDIDPADHPRLFRGIETLKWALKAAPGDAWPEGLPQPRTIDEDFDEPVATQICLRAAELVIMHEIAHGLLGHHGRQWRHPLESREDEQRLVEKENYLSIEQERDADREAFDMYFEGVDRKSDEFIVRGLGAINLIYLPLVMELLQPATPETHPAGWQRLEDLISQLDVPKDHFLIIFTAHLKSLYLAIAGYESGGTATDAHDSLEQLFERISHGSLNRAHRQDTH